MSDYLCQPYWGGVDEKPGNKWIIISSIRPYSRVFHNQLPLCTFANSKAKLTIAFQFHIFKRANKILFE